MDNLDFQTGLAVFNQIQFTRPWLLSLLLLTPLIYGLARLSLRASRWSSWLAEPMLSLLVKSNPTSSKFNLSRLIAFFCLGIIALAGPAIEKPSQLQRSPTSLLIMLDLSLSMLARDEMPSRLGLARFKITDILKQHPDSLAALIVYAGSAHRVIPVTEDHATIINQLASLHPEIMPAFGSDPLQALPLILESVESLKLSAASVLWITDSASSQQIRQLSEQLREHTLDLKLLLVGSTQGGSITLDNKRQLTDNQGRIIQASVPLELMRSAASASQIDAYHLNDLTPASMQQLSQPSPLNPVNAQSSLQLFELGFWFIPLLLLLIAFYLRPQTLLFVILLPTIIVLSGFHSSSQANWKNWWLTPDQQAQKLFDQQRYQQAIETFLEPNWQTASQYRAKQFAEAAQNYQRLGQHYNAGNAFAHAAELNKALAAYEQALKQDPQHSDAQHNKKIISQLLQQQASQQQNNASQSTDQNSNQAEANDNRPNQNTAGKNQQKAQANSADTSDQSLTHDQSHLQQQPNQPADWPDSTSNQHLASTDTQTTQLSQQAIEAQEKAMQYRQWLRSIPDNPSLLLQRKFKRQYQQRHNNRQPNDLAW